MMLAPTHPLQLVLGLIVWSVWFVAIYGGLSLGCALAPPDLALGPVTWLNGLLALVSALVLAWLLRQALVCLRASRSAATSSPRTRFLTTVSAGVYLVAAVSTLFIGLPVLGLPPCT